MTTACNGNGECLLQCDNGKDYFRNPNVVCTTQCSLIRCANFTVCRKAVPRWLMYTNSNKNLCKTCDIIEGNVLTIVHEQSRTVDPCPICFDDTHEMILIRGCNHMICKYCYGKLYLYVTEDFIDRSDPCIVENPSMESSESEDVDNDVDNFEEEERLPSERTCPLCRHTDRIDM